VKPYIYASMPKLMNAGLTVKAGSTFSGYTAGQAIQALINLGILA
jgi:hypothetical protein